MKDDRLVELLKLLASILLCQVTGFIGSLVAGPAIPTWYADLHKPSFAPPNWIYPLVWAAFYLLMGLALFLVWRRAGEKRVRPAVIAFVVQLALHPVWSLAFFGLHSPLAGLVVIVLLCIAILITISLFLRISKAAALLLVPYVLWVSFAGVLNYSFVMLNR